MLFQLLFVVVVVMRSADYCGQLVKLAFATRSQLICQLEKKKIDCAIQYDIF